MMKIREDSIGKCSPENNQGMRPKFGGLAREIAGESTDRSQRQRAPLSLSLSLSLSERVDRGMEV